MNWQIAIDGPAGAGKSTIAKEVAKQLAFTYIDTGAMYRAVTLKAISLKINMEDENEYRFLEDTQINFKDDKIFLDGKNVTSKIRSIEISNSVSLVSKFKYVREKLVSLQQKLAQEKNVIMDGRDIGTVVLPDANLKIFLVASVMERATRRMKERKDSGLELSLEETIQEIEERDRKDTTRINSPLVKAEDAIEIDTSTLTVNEVVEMIIRLVMERGYKMEDVKTNDLNVETEVAEATKDEELGDETVTDIQEEDSQVNLVRELQLVEGVVEKVEDAEEEKRNSKGEVIKKAKKERVLIRLDNGQEGLLFRQDVADVKDDEELADIFLEDDKVTCIVKRVYPDGGKVLLSTVLLKKREELKKFEDVIKNHEVLTAKVVKVIRKKEKEKDIVVGLILEHEGYSCLLPSSQIDVEEDKFDSLIGTEIEIVPIRIDYNRIRLIVSQKVAKAIKNRKEKESFISQVAVGQIYEGTVKNIESYGAFVEIGNNVEGLLHISEIEHNRIVKVEKVLNVGDKVKVQVIKVDKDHIGLSRKALLPNYWKDFIDNNSIDKVVEGEVCEINNAGVVLNLTEHIQAFLPKSEFSWERDTVIDDFTKVGDKMQAKIIELDLNKKRIILSRKRLEDNPWESLKFKSGDQVKATVVKVTPEGVKVTVNGASGFLPKNNFAPGTEFVEGQELDAKVRVFDPNRTRLIITLKEEQTLDKNSVNKLLKSQERVTSTFGDFIDLEEFKKSKK